MTDGDIILMGEPHGEYPCQCQCQEIHMVVQREELPPLHIGCGGFLSREKQEKLNLQERSQE